MLKASLWVAALFALGCHTVPGKKRTEATAETPANERPPAADATPKPPVVLVVGDDFDVSLPVFKDKILGAYTLTGDEIEHEAPKALVKVGADRERWNEGLRAKKIAVTSVTERNLRQALRGHLGTKAAALVAYGNPGVRLVLLALDDASCPAKLAELRKKHDVVMLLDARASLTPCALEGALTVTRAGDSGEELPQPCAGADVLVVGASDHEDARLPSSNHGPCVQVYAPGASLVTAAPDGWLSLDDGTLFAAALVVRQATLARKTAGELRESVLKAAGRKGVIPASAFPKELLFADSTPLEAYASTPSLPIR